MTCESRLLLEKYPTSKKHEFYQNIYTLLHPNYNEQTRTYKKKTENFNFAYKNEKLDFIKDDEFNIDNAKALFPNLKEQDINPQQRTVHERISYYLSNRLVPGFNSSSYDEFKKENVHLKRETTLPKNYLVDKWYFQKKDERKAFYEKYFWDKEIDKLRKKNSIEKQNQIKNKQGQ